MAEAQYYQNDSRWKDVKIGTDQHMTIGMVGCLLTSLTMVMNYFGADETPLTLNQKMVASGGLAAMDQIGSRAGTIPRSRREAAAVRRLQKSCACANGRY